MTFQLPDDCRITVRLPEDMHKDIQAVVDYLEDNSIDTDNSKVIRFLINKGLEKLKLEGKIK